MSDHNHEHEQEHGEDRAYETTALEQARERLESDTDFIDLVDTNFHRNGFLYPEGSLSRALAAYPQQRPYAPDPRGSPAAREVIADYYRARGLDVDPAQVIITASASEGYNLVFNRMVEHGRTVSLPRPVYPLFEFIAEFNHLDVEHYALDLNHRAQPNLLRLRAEISENSGLIVAISPNNPTGTCLEAQSVEAIVSVARERNVPVLFDEVFSEFRFRGPGAARAAGTAEGATTAAAHITPAGLADDVVCITLNGVSKMFACPDLKLSWLLVTGPEDLREELLSVLEIANDMYLNASSVSQAVLPTLFTEGGGFQRNMIEEIERRRDLCLSTVAGSPHLHPLYPDGGIHCILRVGRDSAAGHGAEASHGGWDDEELALRILEDTKVYTHPGYLYDIEGETALVASFLKEPDALEEGLRRITRWFER
ncbi:MAG: aminotransferase class I/II-fold pyridoxal phosphate-dependent enzyme [Spirochaetes bacterium]|jgi:aspartate/methionine/tyrosine aminotransferase|nr:aminotransferase class I/II-fold pyridoxal phosphate-dependent enzyme [Spirochaetota bacterium]